MHRMGKLHLHYTVKGALIPMVLPVIYDIDGDIMLQASLSALSAIKDLSVKTLTIASFEYYDSDTQQSETILCYSHTTFESS